MLYSGDKSAASSKRDWYWDSMIIHGIGVAPTTPLRTCVIKIVTFEGGYLMWYKGFSIL